METGTESETDVAVVGGGIIGAAIALRVSAAHRGRRITVLDQGDTAPGSGSATRRSLGVLAPWASTPGQRRLLERGAVWTEDPAVRALLRPHLRRVPVLVVARAATLDTMARHTIGTRMDPASGELTGAARAAWGEPLLGRGDGLATVRGGITVMDTAGAAAALLDAVAGAHGRVRLGARVTRIESRSGSQRLLLADGGLVSTSRTVLATGAWPGPEVASQGPERPPWRTKRMAALRIDRDLPPGAPLLCFPDDDLFLLPAPDGTGAPGGGWASFRCEEWDVPPGTGGDGGGPRTEGQAGPRTGDRAGPRTGDQAGPWTGDQAGPWTGATWSPRTLAAGRAVLAGRLPGLAPAAVPGPAAVDGYTPDRTPLTDRPAPGVVRAAAASGGGARFSWGIADRVLELLAL
ncbi:FAD-dependent oxidoreductase [Streptomyces sp. NPDC056480]|uniref:FAD-dependent oxidoreductase n=1 Tax=Streptomyces sp. NPDC056480 TaxID=3345833 RepID=UPI00368F3B01